ncbi:hypothetical protein SLE2022_254510 [Rubroshorea leprosula]
MCPMWTESIFRCLPSSIFRWPDFNFSQFSFGWSPRSFLQRWMEFSIVDDVFWIFVTALESLALAAMLCFFLVFCGCSI